MSMYDLDQETIKELFSYDPETGEFVRRKWINGCAKNAKMSSRPRINGYRYHVSHLIWRYVYGKWPDEFIDHINGDHSDNRLSNLRDVPQAINNQNTHKIETYSKTGIVGVYLSNKNGYKYSSAIRVDSELIRLGHFETIEEAREAYIEAKRKYHEGCTI